MFVHGPYKTDKTQYVARSITTECINWQMRSRLVAYIGVISVEGTRWWFTCSSDAYQELRMINQKEYRWRLSIKDCLCHVKVLLIDEISLVMSYRFAHIDSLLRYIINNDANFGGMHVILIDDIFWPCQWKEIHCIGLWWNNQGVKWNLVKKPNVCQMERNCSENSVSSISCNMKYPLVRDIWQTSRSYIIHTLKLHQLWYIHLSMTDINSNASYLYMYVIVMMNVEMMLLNELQLRSWAKKYDKPMLSYFVNTLIDKCYREYEHDGENVRRLSNAYLSFNKLFAVGAPCQLINKNVNVKKGLSNGSFRRMHSITFNEEW